MKLKNKLKYLLVSALILSGLVLYLNIGDYNHCLVKLKEINNEILERDIYLRRANDKNANKLELEFQKNVIYDTYFTKKYNSEIVYEIFGKFYGAGYKINAINIRETEEYYGDRTIDILLLNLNIFCSYDEIENIFNLIENNFQILIVEDFSLIKDGVDYKLNISIEIPILNRTLEEETLSLYNFVEQVESITLEEENNDENSSDGFQDYRTNVEERIDKILLEFVENKLEESSESEKVHVEDE